LQIANCKLQIEDGWALPDLFGGFCDKARRGRPREGPVFNYQFAICNLHFAILREEIMKGFTKTALAMAGAIGLVGCAGGERYRNLVDPCSMERYGAEARQEYITCFTPQVQNGRILDQTIWNYNFEAGTDKLNPSGYDKLDQIVRRRPEPDNRIFIQTARDIAYNPAQDGFADARRELDAKRGAAIEKYLAAQTAGRPMQFALLVHDPADPGMAAVSAATANRSQRLNYTGVMAGGAGGGVVGAASSGQQGPPPQQAGGPGGGQQGYGGQAGQGGQPGGAPGPQGGAPGGGPPQ
jgi:hypothetical protein